MKRIRDDGWTSIEGGALARNVPLTDAVVSAPARSTLSSAAACFERVFADFMENVVLDPINQVLAHKRSTHDVKRLRPIDRQVMINFFVA